MEVQYLNFKEQYLNCKGTKQLNFYVENPRECRGKDLLLPRNWEVRRVRGKNFLRLNLHLKEESILRIFWQKTEDCAKLRQMQLFILTESKHLYYKPLFFILFSNLRKIFFWSWHKRIIIIMIIIIITIIMIHCSRIIQILTFNFKCTSLENILIWQASE